MQEAEARSHAALYLWDYFYVSNRPERGDEKAWGMIERATCRIRESEVELRPSVAPDVRLRHARRIRNSARVALRHVEQLSVAPEKWAIDWLVQFEALASELIETLADPARHVVLD